MLLSCCEMKNKTKAPQLHFRISPKILFKLCNFLQKSVVNVLILTERHALLWTTVVFWLEVTHSIALSIGYPTKEMKKKKQKKQQRGEEKKFF